MGALRQSVPQNGRAHLHIIDTLFAKGPDCATGPSGVFLVGALFFFTKKKKAEEEEKDKSGKSPKKSGRSPKRTKNLKDKNLFMPILLIGKIPVSVKFMSTILGPEMGAPILWTPGKMHSFCRKNHVRKISLFWGGFWGGGGGGRFYFYGRADFSEMKSVSSKRCSPPKVCSAHF